MKKNIALLYNSFDGYVQWNKECLYQKPKILVLKYNEILIMMLIASKLYPVSHIVIISSIETMQFFRWNILFS